MIDLVQESKPELKDQDFACAVVFLLIHKCMHMLCPCPFRLRWLHAIFRSSSMVTLTDCVLKGHCPSVCVWISALVGGVCAVVEHLDFTSEHLMQQLLTTTSKMDPNLITMMMTCTKHQLLSNCSDVVAGCAQWWSAWISHQST